MTDSSFSRRDFLQLTASAAAMLGLTGCAGIKITPSPKVRKVVTIAPGAKVRLAWVGFNGKGDSDIRASARSGLAEIVALCDVDWGLPNVKKVGDSFPNAKRYTDYRQMLLEMDDKIDAVGVSTPDHNHFLPAYMAMAMGKHVHVQKPLTQTVWEADQLLQLARQTGACTQMGNQGHAGEGCRLVREWVDADVFGPITTVHIWTNRPIWPQGMKAAIPSDPPKDLKWDLWLGRAAARPYAGDQNYPDYKGTYYDNLHKAYHPFNWRGWRAFGGGALADMGCHIMDASFWALHLDEVDPLSIEAKTVDLTEEAYPLQSSIVYKFPARGKMPPLTLTWNDGGTPDKPNLPEVPAEYVPARGLARGGMMLIGTKGAIYCADDYCNVDSIMMMPTAKAAELRRAARAVPKTIRRAIPAGEPQVEWLQAIQKNQPSWAGSNFEYSVPLTKLVVLGNLAVFTGKPIQWDGKKMKCTNVPEANKFVKPVFRKGWSPADVLKGWSPADALNTKKS